MVMIDFCVFVIFAAFVPGFVVDFVFVDFVAVAVAVVDTFGGE